MRFLLLSLLFLAPPSFPAQEKPPCNHVDDSLERFAAMRLLPPAQVLYVEPVEGGQKLEYRIETKHVTKYGTFTLTKDTAVEPGALKKGKLVWILYSICDDHVYTVVTVRPEQIIK